jgi:hypothetical protein
LKHNYEYTSRENTKITWGGDIHYYSVNPGERKVLDQSNILPITSSDKKHWNMDFIQAPVTG